MSTESQTTSSNEAVVENEQPVKRNWWRTWGPRTLKISIFLISGMFLILLTMKVVPNGTVVALIQVLLLPIAAGVIEVYHWLWSGKSIRNHVKFWGRAVLPALAMSVIFLVTFGFVDTGRIVTWAVGEKHAIGSMYGYSGWHGFVSFPLLWALMSLGIYSYLFLLVPLVNRQYSLRSVSRRITRALCVVLATFPALLMVAMAVNNTLL